jgi:hypothetical protein
MTIQECGRLLLAPAVALALVVSGHADEPPKKGPSTINDLSLEVVALQSLHQFQFKPEQMQALRKLSRETAMEAGARQKVKASDEFQRTLASLRTALTDAGNAERIQELQQKMDKLRAAEKVELDDNVEITEASLKRAPEIMKTLTARQIAGYIALYGDEFPDPLEVLLEALGKVRGLKDKEWEQLRQDVSEDVGNLTAGLDTDKASQIGDQVVQLLIHARALKADEFKNQQAELEKSARAIVGNIGALTVIQHVVERSLAELLSNPRLVMAIDARLKK